MTRRARSRWRRGAPAVVLLLALAEAGCNKAQTTYGGVACEEGSLAIVKNDAQTLHASSDEAVRVYLTDPALPDIARDGYEIGRRGPGTEEWVHKDASGTIDASIGLLQDNGRWKVAGVALCQD